jgi:hypothetical protein
MKQNNTQRTSGSPYQMFAKRMQSFQVKKLVNHDGPLSFISKLGMLCMFMLFSVNGVMGQIISFNPYGLAAYGTSPYAATSANASLTVGGLTRGSGIGTSGTAAGNAWGGVTTVSGTPNSASALSGGQFFTFTSKVATGKTVSYSTFDWNYRRSGTATPSADLQYSTDGTTFTNISTGISLSTSSSSGAAITQVSLSGVSALQNVSSTTTVTFRIIAYGNTGAGTLYVYNTSSATNAGILIGGTITNSSTPTISTTGTLAALNTTYGTASTAQSFSISGSGLSASLTATAPTGFAVSRDNSTFQDTVQFAQSSGSASGTLYIRLKADASVTGSYNSQNIVLSSTGASSVNIVTASSGNAVTEKALTITGISAVNKVYDGTTSASLTGTAAYSGLVAGETYTVTGTASASFTGGAVGNGKAVSVTGYTAPSSNYSLTQPTLSADITEKALTITGISGVNRAYNGTTTASLTGTPSLVGVITADTSNVTLGGIYSATFASASVGTGIAITVSGYSISGSAAGNYALTQPTGLTANITFALNASVNQSISCYGFNNGSIDAVATPAGPSYTFSIDGGASTNTTGFFENITPGTHTICASDGNTTVCQSVVMTEPDALTVSLATSSTVSCLGNDGALTATITGGTNSIQPYLTTWSNGLNVDSLYALSATGLSATTYTITVEDDRQCFATATAAVGTAAAVSVTASNTSIVCLGGTSTITTSASGGTGAKTTSISGGSFTVNAGTYTITATDTKGCTGTTVITINQPAQITNSSSVTACNSYAFNGTTYTTSGVYTHTFTNANSCDSIYTLNLTVNYSSTNGSSSATSCDSYTWNGATYTTSGSYTYTTTNASACVNTATLTLTINNNSTSSSSATACDTYTWACNGVAYTTSGNYTCTSNNAAGCVNTATLNLTINNSSTSSSSATACDSYTWACNGVSYTTSGNYTCTSNNAAGCVNTATLNLTINNSSTSSPSATACDSYTWSCNGVTYTTSGNYTCTSNNAAGCVNTATLNLTINNSSTSTPSATACDSYTWTCNNVTYTNSGSYTCTSLNASGCVNTATLGLTINRSTSSSSSESACGTYTWNCNNATYTVSGNYTCTSLNNAGCVHTATLNLTINSNSSSTLLSATACDSYTWACNGVTYTTSGNYTCTSMNALGCLNTATLDLTINASSTSSSSATACNTYTWNCNNATYTTSGNYMCTSLNNASCTNTATLNLTVNYTSTTGNDNQTACNTYTWNGASYSTTGVYTFTSVNNSGCTNTATLNLTVNYSSTNGNATQTACDSYTWNGSTYNTSGVYTFTTLNAASCVNTATLNLTINASSTNGNASQTACNSYLWNGTTYTTSGVYTFTSLNNAGCTNTATLTLTVNYSSTNGNATQTSCDSYTWNGSTYNTSGSYTYTTLNNAGCTNTATLTLVINYSSTNGNATQTACNSYSWNGASYTASGVYTYTELNNAGCTNTATLNLTVNYSSTNGDTTKTVCNSYTWNGTSYTTSGVYTYTNLNALGCTNTATLNLTVNYSSTNGNESQTACDSYSWNGLTYNTSGVYTFTTLNAASCVNTATLTLSINYSSTNGNLTTSACDSYTWNSSTYTASGTYTYTSLNASNCTNTATLILTMNASSSSSATNTSYVSYTWASNSVTYTASGTYTATSLNASGCVHTSTLNLTVLSGISLAAKVILSGAYNVATGLMHDSLRVNNLIPTTEPYSSAPFLKPQVGGAGLETVSEQTLAVTGNDAIVDWVFVELRSSSNSTSILATKRALLQRDGDIVNADGTSPLFFSGIAGGNYYVSIKHRNHLGVMSAAAQALAYAPTTVDFTSTSFAVYTNAAIANAPRRTQGGVATLWPGDANNNKNVKYNGLSNDKEAVLQTVGAGSVNNIASGYRTEDVNLDGKVKYNSTDNDRSVIGAQVGVINPNIILSQHTPN